MTRCYREAGKVEADRVEKKMKLPTSKQMMIVTLFAVALGLLVLFIIPFAGDALFSGRIGPGIALSLFAIVVAALFCWCMRLIWLDAGREQ